MNQARTAAAPDLERAQPLTADELRLIDAYWRAANYLSVGQIYLFDNPLLKRPLRLEDIKPRLLGHWGTTPGLNFIHAHANRLIKKRDLDAIYIMGPGHGGPAGVANAYLEGTYTERDLIELMRGYGHAPVIVSGDDPPRVHQQMAAALDWALDEIARIQGEAHSDHHPGRPSWPMIILRTPKGWTGPKNVDGEPIEGTFRAHQVPVTGFASDPSHVKILEDWLLRYRPEELFDKTGKVVDEVLRLPPQGDRRMSANPHANGGELLRDLRLPDFRDYAIAVARPGTTTSEATRVLGGYLRDVIKMNPDNFRIVGPDETESNRLSAVFEATKRTWDAEVVPGDDHLAPEGRVMEVLSEHMCEGWLEGYLLTGRHGLFDCYEAFIHIIDSMFNQHAKWLKVTRHIPWRRPIASLNYLLSSHVWRQDHNGFSHQDPGFIDHVVNKKAEVIRVYLPPDANTLLSVTDHCLRRKNYVNAVVVGRLPAPQW